MSMDLPVKLPEPGGGRRTRYKIETKSLSYELPANSSRALLRSVSCEARPGELLAIVGSSGAGKTTLLSVLAGVIHPSRVSGEILVNGRRMDVARFRRVSGYVKQDDALFPLLTVEETLMYSARLRLGGTRSELAARVHELLKELGLDHVAGSRIGDHGGISGGEKRRVTIGVDLVHDPAVLLLDEPTSGLDSASALNVVTMLKAMAVVHGKTVVLTVHQPGFRIVELFDRVLLISDGAVRHQGSVQLLEKRLWDAGHLIPHDVNVLEYAMDAMASLTMAVDYAHSPQEEGKITSCITKQDRIFYANSRCGEVFILASRFFNNILRTKQLFTARMIQSLVAGFGLGTTFMNVASVRAQVGFFAFNLTFLLASTTECLPISLQERSILLRETSRGAYRVSSYVIASVLVFLPFLLAAALLYAIPVYWLVGLRREMDCFLYFSLVAWLVMLTANSFVACFSALVPNFIVGNSLIMGLMGWFFLFSGYFISKQRIPNYWIFMHYLSLFKYPFEALLINEYGGMKGRRKCMKHEDQLCLLDGGMILRQQGLEETEKWRNLGVMLGFICGYRILCFVLLWVRCYKMRS